MASDRIVIVCKEVQSRLILSLLNQIGWKSRIQAIITEKDLALWYEKALKGRFAENMGQRLLYTLKNQIELEFPSSCSDVLESRGYKYITDDFWT